MMLPMHRSFVGCKIYEMCYKEVYFYVVWKILRQILNKIADITGSEDVLGSGNVLLKVIDGVAARMGKMMLETTLDLSPTQSFSTHITHFLANMFKASSRFPMRK